jgi:formylglycine-generating enzyme required for sulfatase activity
VIFYEMICARRPFDDSSSAATASAILTRDPLPIARFAPHTPPEFDRIIMKALRKNADERYQTAKDLLVDLRALKEEHTFQARLERSNPSTDRPAFPAPQSGSAPAVAGPRLSMAWPIAAIVLIALAAGGWWWRGRANAQWVNGELLQIADLAAKRQYYEAYDRAVAVEPYSAGNSTLTALMASIADTLSVESEPAGAHVYLKRFAPGSTGQMPERQLAGTTPMKNLRIARGQYVLSLDLNGYAPYEQTVSGVAVRQGTLTVTPPPTQLKVRLVPASAMPAKMVLVPGSGYRLVAWSRPTDRREALNDFYIDKYEVSNREFKEFISAGGYIKREYWSHPFVKDGKSLNWNEAMALFVDRTKLAGPRDWTNQEIPDGKADYPVTGVSWYEASAYAAFRGKALPTVFEWEKAARNGVVPMAGTVMMPWGLFYAGDSLDHRANFGAAVWPVTEGEFGMSSFGAYNMAGNVSEWTRNDSSDGYLATGGAVGDPTYTFAQFGGRPPAFSSSKLGFRLAKAAATPAGDQGGERIEMAAEVPDFKPSSPELFAKLAAQYRYEPKPLEARVEETINATDWTRETITFKGAWGGERATAYLYMPKNVPRPVQVLHYVPAGDVAGGLRSLTASTEDGMAVYLKTGRAVFSVLLKGYYGRPLVDNFRPDTTQIEYADYLMNQVGDLRRGLDYLASRPDVDGSRLVFYGPSAGAQLGLILAAIETRYKGVFLQGAGLAAYHSTFTPAANPINFASHIMAPKFIMQGRYDEDTPLKTMADPLYKLLSEPKQRLIYEGTHVPTDDVRIPAVIPWLNTILGPVIK